MKFIIIQIFFLISLDSYCQTGNIVGHIINSDELPEYNYLTVYLMQQDSTIKIVRPDSNGVFKILNTKMGIYSLVICQLGNRNFVTDSIQVLSDTTQYLNLTYPPPCPYVYVKGKTPKCIGGHTDNIVSIAYGLPEKRIVKKANKGLIYLGGCIVTDCDPYYYCKIHKREL